MLFMFCVDIATYSQVFFLQMRQSLELRLAEAEKDIKAAEKLKFEREDWARKALKHQEVIMEKVVEEANLLKQQAEANAKVWLIFFF